MSNHALYLALRCARAVLPRIPLRFAYLLADFAGLLSYLLFGQARRAICANLAVVLSKPARSREVRQLARDAFANDAKNWVDTLRIHRVTPEEITRAVTVDHWERIDQALSLGRGLIVVGIHLGNFDLVGQVVAARGLKLTVPVERMRPPELFDLLVAERRSQGLNVVPIESAPRELLRALRSGEIAGLTGDRNIMGKTIDVEFFHRPTPLPRGPASLARRTGAPLVLGVGVRLPSRLFMGFVSEPIEVKRTDDAEADDRETTQRLAREMERLVSRYPGQWLVFSPVWPASHKAATLTVEQTEAAV